MRATLSAAPKVTPHGHTSPEMGVQMYGETGHYARPPPEYFSHQKLLAINRLTAVRPRRNQRNRNRKLPLQKLYVVLQSAWQRLSLNLLSEPAFQLLIYRRDLFVYKLVRKNIRLPAIPKLVSRANFHAREHAQHIRLHHQQLRYAVDHDGILQRRKIDPTTTSWPPRGRPKLVPLLAHQVALLVQ